VKLGTGWGLIVLPDISSLTLTSLLDTTKLNNKVYSLLNSYIVPSQHVWIGMNIAALYIHAIARHDSPASRAKQKVENKLDWLLISIDKGDRSKRG
jgi:hypothetical protein